MDLLLPLLLLIPLLLIFTSGRRRQKEAATTQSRLAPGAQVITTAGLYARVVEVEDVAVVLEPAPGVRTRWARGAIARVVDDAGDVPDAVAPASAGASTVDGDPVSGTVIDPADRARPAPDAGGPGEPGAARR